MSSHFILLLAIILLHYVNVRGIETPPGNLTDLNLCKVSHLGLDYVGDISTTESRVKCQSWTASDPIHKVNPAYTDDKFSEFSKRDAKSYCRNPSHDPLGPWCYTLAKDLINETCAIPLCIFTECRITGPGMEYGGVHKVGTSDRKCLKWNKKRKRVLINGEVTKYEKFPKYNFQEQNLAKAGKHCRNPDGDPGGPWCFVEIEGSSDVNKEYCDIPFCNEPECTFLSKEQPLFTHYTKFDQSEDEIMFGIKVWNPDEYMDAKGKLCLTVSALPFSEEQLEKAGTSIVVEISNRGTSLTVGNVEKPHYETTPQILKATEYTFFTLSWAGSFLTLNKVGVAKPIFLAQYKMKDNLMALSKNKFYYYAVRGHNLLWSMKDCTDNERCAFQVTTSGIYERYWPLGATAVGHDLKFFVRSAQSANVLLVPSPVIPYPKLEIFLNMPDNFTRIFIKVHAKATKVTMFEIASLKLIEYFKWREFSVSLFADALSFYKTVESGTFMIAEVKSPDVRLMRWFSIGSDSSMAHWALFCKPPIWSNPPPSYPPECALDTKERMYNGTQSVTFKGYPCVPWAAYKVLPDEASQLFKSKDNAIEIFNFCRDPRTENQGTFCYAAVTQGTRTNITKEYCRLRQCKSVDCKMAGTGNDYIGKVTMSRSNRTCQYWSAKAPTQEMKFVPDDLKHHFSMLMKPLKKIENLHARFKPPSSDFEWMLLQHSVSLYKDKSGKDILFVHAVRPAYMNNSLYADMSVENAENFCRNPQRNIGGSFCYTLDPQVPMDLCNIRDCTYPEECTVLMDGTWGGRKIFILPQWKERGIEGGLHFSVKLWNPDLPDGIEFEILPEKEGPHIRLLIGANSNEKLMLYLDSKLIKEKSAVHILPSGRWVDFWLQTRKGEIMFGYSRVPDPLFEWKHEDIDFEPFFLSYKSIKGNPVGMYFKCDECHTENTTSEFFTKVYPIGWWQPTLSEVRNNFTMKLRGRGEITVALMNMPREKYFFTIQIQGREIRYTKIYYETVTPLKVSLAQHDIVRTDKWSNMSVQYDENIIRVIMDNVLLLEYISNTPMLFYWFSVSSRHGWVTWTANCEPLDIDGVPLDGGWSEWSKWQCSISCGGGSGVRTRTCSNPRPNVYGKLCQGTHESTGTCNEFPCGDISPTTIEQIRNRLRSVAFSFVVERDEKIVMPNDREMMSIVMRESPEATYEWTRNGLLIDPEVGRVSVRSDAVTIMKTRLSDTGVYVCMIYRINGKRLVLRVVSLAVTTHEFTVFSRQTLSLTLKTNAVILGYVYSELSQVWLIDDVVYKDYGITTLAAVNTEIVKPLNKSHTGVWKCMITQGDLRLSWITAWVKVKVRKAPNLYTHLMEDSLTRPLFGWMKYDEAVLTSIIILIVVVFALVAFGVFAYLRWGTLPKRTKGYKKLKRKVEDDADTAQS